ncbi:MAG: hypothetical protein KatS3mg015_2920 [Fimbriimonadales bacterium]|nr:MAG: hypothetical protein KatS3mg015_2920 [Fimbriimonadales bacterium]
MYQRIPILASLLLLAGVSCGSPNTIETIPTTTTTTTTTVPPSDPDMRLTDLAVEAAEREAAERAEREAAGSMRVETPADTLGRCGGNLPPCSVKRQESGGRYDAVNPTGCEGRGCYGAWQFDPLTWDATVTRMGRPDLVGNYLASPDDQDAAAAYLWAGGAGCGHWSAC